MTADLSPALAALIRYIHSQPYALLIGRKQFAPDCVLTWDGERLVME